MHEALGNFIQDQLNTRGWDQVQLEIRSGVSNSTLSRLITGTLKREPQLSTLYQIARGLDVPLSQILDVMGYPVEAPGPRSLEVERVAALAEALPWLRPVAEELAALPPDERSAVLAFLDSLRRRRQPPAPESLNIRDRG